MADFMPKDFGSMGLGYANWRKMAGLDKSPFPSNEQSGGVAPPSQTVGQQWDAAKSEIAAVPKAFGHLMQGNLTGAANAFKPQPVAPVISAPVVQPVAQPALQTSEPEEVDYMSQIWGTK